MNFDDACAYLVALSKRESSLGQITMKREAILKLLAVLGNPQLGRKTAHIVGSKGKGSTSTYIASILHSSNFSTAHFTSPHLSSFAERICFDMQKCSQEEFAGALSEIRENVETISYSELGPVSTFGALTGMFFQLAKKRQVDWQILEAGLGGQNDATNVLESTEIVLVTAISLEHTAILGKTTTEIAENKIGVMRPGSIVVLARQSDPQVTEVIRRRCEGLHAELVEVEETYRYKLIDADSKSQRFEIMSDNQDTRRFSIAMLGKHQLDNAATAIAGADALANKGHKISQQSLQDGLAQAFVPGRLELMPGKPRVVVDGAHNAESLQALVSALKGYFEYKKLIVILGAADDKDIEGMVAALKDVSTLIACPTPLSKTLDPRNIVKLGKAKAINCFSCDSISEALNKAVSLCDEQDLICVTGSLYLVAQVRELMLMDPKPIAG